MTILSPPTPPSPPSRTTPQKTVRPWRRPPAKKSSRNNDKSHRNRKDNGNSNNSNTGENINLDKNDFERIGMAPAWAMLGSAGEEEDNLPQPNSSTQEPKPKSLNPRPLWQASLASRGRGWLHPEAAFRITVFEVRIGFKYVVG